MTHPRLLASLETQGPVDSPESEPESPDGILESEPCSGSGGDGRGEMGLSLSTEAGRRWVEPCSSPGRKPELASAGELGDGESKIMVMATDLGLLLVGALEDAVGGEEPEGRGSSSIFWAELAVWGIIHFSNGQNRSSSSPSWE